MGGGTIFLGWGSKKQHILLLILNVVLSVGNVMSPVEILFVFKLTRFKTLVTFHYSGWLMGSLEWLVIIPLELCRLGSIIPYFAANNQGFDDCSTGEMVQLNSHFST